MANALITNCGFLFVPQLVVNIAVVMLIAGYGVALWRQEVPPQEHPWEKSLDPLANVAVAIGLFGSVIGFISAFQGFQKGVDISKLLSGLSIAYWTTGVGIFSSLLATLGTYFLNLLSGKK